MIPVVTSSQMREIDRMAINGNPSLGYSYMLKAGMGIVECVRKILPDGSRGPVAVVCGKGNNGGDGFTAARLLFDSGYRVMCYGLCSQDELKGEARMAYEEFAARRGNFMLLTDTADVSCLQTYSLIIDALLGSGVHGNPHGLMARVIEAVNASGVPVLAVDIPSGLDVDAGRPGVPCIKADYTVTMGFPKIGLYFYPARSFAGTLIAKELGYPDEIVGLHHKALYVPENADFKKWLPPRKPSGSKFDHGVALMICGSRGMTGAAALASLSALRTGCGMVHLASAASAIPALAIKLTEVVLHGCAETAEGSLAVSALDQIKVLMHGKQAFCLGPGLSHHEDTRQLVRQCLRSFDGPLLLDADGLNAFAGATGALKDRRGALLITPHQQEWQRLFGELPAEPMDKIERLRDTAREYQMTILYKGNPTIVAEEAGLAYVLPYGNSGMATAGSGDVLAGIITSLIAQGAPLTGAAVLGAYLHGEAGNAAARKWGEYSMVASDIRDAIYRAIGLLTGNHAG
ncbi:MAG: NAD(P)H-hydrate dehydratase [Chitinivibrionales bacterium]|nr:NAD(P)H-hydrate dehydratase [Chitinivibrionales bacterium]